MGAACSENMLINCVSVIEDLQLMSGIKYTNLLSY